MKVHNYYKFLATTNMYKEIFIATILHTNLPVTEIFEVETSYLC